MAVSNPKSGVAHLLYTNQAITTAITGNLGSEFFVPDNCRGLVLQSNFVVGGGGTTMDAWVQGSLDDTNWVDMVCFKATTSSLRQVASVSADNVMAGLAPAIALDATLGDNLILDGWIGTKIRVKVTTTGTYTGTTTLDIHCKYLLNATR